MIVFKTVFFMLSLTLQACSFSYSSDSLSHSLDGSSDSSSSSTDTLSSAAKSDKQYRLDIQNYTRTYAQYSNADSASFQKGLADIASIHGIVDWEENPTTFIAIENGLKQANLSSSSHPTFKNKLISSATAD